MKMPCLACHGRVEDRRCKDCGRHQWSQLHTLVGQVPRLVLTNSADPPVDPEGCGSDVDGLLRQCGFEADS